MVISRTKKVSNRLPFWLDKFFRNTWSSAASLVVAGAIYPLAFSPFDIWPLAFVSLFWLLASLFSDSISAFKSGFCWGLGCFGAGASWVYVSIHEFGFVPAFGAVCLTLLFVLLLSLYKSIFAVLTVWILKKSHDYFILLVAPLCWVISELIQATVLNGFPWLLAGYSQIDSPLGAFASWFGVYGVSWLTLSFAAGLFALIVFQHKKTHVIAMMTLVGIVTISQIYYVTLTPQNSGKTLDISLIQPNVLQHEKWDRRYFGKIVNTLYDETESSWGADLILWPEGAIPAFAHQVNDITHDLTKRATKSGSQIILGIPFDDPQDKQSYVALNAYGSEPQSYFKQVLVPFGEYVPFESALRGMIKFLDLPMSGFTEATNQSPMEFSEYSIVPAICYEIAYPQIISDLSEKALNRSDKPQLIVTVSNEAWFGDSLGPHQHMQMARMRAKELGIPLARATNDGVSGFVDAKGKLIASLPRYQQTHLRKEIELINYHTLYRNWKLWGLAGLLLVNLLLIVVGTAKFAKRYYTRSTSR